MDDAPIILNLQYNTMEPSVDYIQIIPFGFTFLAAVVPSPTAYPTPTPIYDRVEGVHFLIKKPPADSTLKAYTPCTRIRVAG